MSLTFFNFLSSKPPLFVNVRKPNFTVTKQIWATRRFFTRTKLRSADFSCSWWRDYHAVVKTQMIPTSPSHPQLKLTSRRSCADSCNNPGYRRVVMATMLSGTVTGRQVVITTLVDTEVSQRSESKRKISVWVCSAHLISSSLLSFNSPHSSTRKLTCPT